jgi:large subunit ribosomal protein L15
MKLNDLQPAPGSHREKDRAGRGISGGQGKTAGKGTKGQNARSGGGKRQYFEGGQLPLVRRLPFLRGFTNLWRVEYEPVNVERLNSFKKGSDITPETLAAAGIIKSPSALVKVLGNGEIDRALNVKVHKFSSAAREKILAAGGTVEELTPAVSELSEAAG